MDVCSAEKYRVALERIAVLPEENYITKPVGSVYRLQQLTAVADNKAQAVRMHVLT